MTRVDMPFVYNLLIGVLDARGNDSSGVADEEPSDANHISDSDPVNENDLPEARTGISYTLPPDAPTRLHHRYHRVSILFVVPLA